jgi:hypothetical protein
MENKNIQITKLYDIIKSSYYKHINIDNFNPNHYISVEQFIKILSVMHLKSDRHFNSYKPISYTEVPLGCVNASGNGYLYIPRTDYYLSKANCYRFVEYAHIALVQIALQLQNKPNKTYVIDFRCNSGGLLMLFVACIFPFIKSRGKLGEGIDINGKVKYEHHISDNEFYVKDSNNNKFIRIEATPRNPLKATLKKTSIINYGCKLQPDTHIREYKSIIVNDYIPESEDYGGFKIQYPKIEFDNLVILVDHGSGSASEFMTSILHAEGAQIYGSKTIGIVTQNISIREEDNLIILPTCLFRNIKNETYPDGITPDNSEIPTDYLPIM